MTDHPIAILWLELRRRQQTAKLIGLTVDDLLSLPADITRQLLSITDGYLQAESKMNQDRI